MKACQRNFRFREERQDSEKALLFYAWSSGKLAITQSAASPGTNGHRLCGFAHMSHVWRKRGKAAGGNFLCRSDPSVNGWGGKDASVHKHDKVIWTYRGGRVCEAYSYLRAAGKAAKVAFSLQSPQYMLSLGHIKVKKWLFYVFRDDDSDGRKKKFDPGEPFQGMTYLLSFFCSSLCFGQWESNGKETKNCKWSTTSNFLAAWESRRVFGNSVVKKYCTTVIPLSCAPFS